MKKHIALLGKTACFSDGGIFFITLVAKALVLKKKQNNSIKISLLLPDILCLTPLRVARLMCGNIKRFLFNIIGIKESCSYVPGRSIIHAFREIDKDIKIIFYNDKDKKSLESCLKQIKADVVLPAMEVLDKSFPVPWIGGLYDLQYKYYPEFFPKINFGQRDGQVKTMLSHAKAIVVNSKNTKSDINKFFPGHTCEIFPFPFVSHPDKEWFSCDFQKIVKKYKLPKRYFLISNQFWVHKSHKTAFEALKILHENEKYKDIHIVCTGVTNDPRFPNYFKELKASIDASMLKNHIIFLGRIPHMDQIGIMRNALAVLQPTLFEGGPGGGSTYYAVSLGVPVILSDIPVNVLISDEKNVTFFKAKSSDDMAEKMIVFLEKHNTRKFDRETLIENGNLRLNKLGDTLMDAVSLVTK